RMGAFKPLLTLEEQTVADRVISIFQDNKVDVFLVTGWRRKELVAGLKSRDITIVDNPDYERGMFTSVQAGVRKLPPRYNAFFIMPVDIPLVRPATIAWLLTEGDNHPDKIIYPIFGAVRGHPPLLPYRLASTIIEQPGDSNLSVILKSREGIALDVKVADSYILNNINTTQDYRILLEHFQRYDVPTEAECVSIKNDICKTPINVQRHCARVAEVAVKIGRAVDPKGKRIDLGIVRAAASLHDIAKEQPNHDVAGGEVLRSAGFSRVGNIVAVHTDLSGGEIEPSLDAKIVYLADKLVVDEKIVSLDERYQLSRERLSANPELKDIIARRKQHAMEVKQEIEALCGCPLEEITSQWD
ncbi:MAG: NTP transferase domain-containing protein, partial [Dehalococcoidales bacterium]|nr:NTP transferase domain-containing protein [Dehalococcoidales bacterium]